MRAYAGLLSADGDGDPEPLHARSLTRARSSTSRTSTYAPPVAEPIDEGGDAMAELLSVSVGSLGGGPVLVKFSDRPTKISAQAQVWIDRERTYFWRRGS